VSRNGVIALLAAGFAIFSVIPPVDAFTVTRVSQISRLEGMLHSAGILVDGQLVPQANVDLTVRRETTNVLHYLEQHDYLDQVRWLPKDFMAYQDMQATLGFPPTYAYAPDFGQSYFVNLSPQTALPIGGYDVLLQASSWRQQPAQAQDFTVQGTPYRLLLTRTSSAEVIVSVLDADGAELISTGLRDFAAALLSNSAAQPKEMLSAEQMTLDAVNGQNQLRIIFQNIQATEGSQNDGIDYQMYVLIAVKR
jgi:hypothetical protein